MSMTGKLTDGRIALVKSNIRLALEDLGAARARVAESNCDGERDGYIGKVFSGQERLLREALQALS